VVTKTKVYVYTEVYDEGEWLRAFFEAARAGNQYVPDTATVERIREKVFQFIAQESMPLVA